MPQAALREACAELEQAEEAFETGADAEIQTEQPSGMTLEELEAAFAMFGVKVEPEHGSAEADYRVDGPGRPVANDAAPMGFTLPRRVPFIEPSLTIRAIQAFDWVVVLAAAQFAAQWGAGVGLTSLGIGDALSFLLAASALKAGLWLTDSYRTTPARIRPERGVGGLALGAILGLAIATFLAPDARAAGALAAIVPAAALLLAGVHAAFAVWISALHRAGAFSETVVLVGASDAAERLASRAASAGEAHIAAVFDDRLARSPNSLAGAPVLGGINDLMAWEHLPHVDRIVIAVTPKAEERVGALIARLRTLPNRVDLLLNFDAKSVNGRGVERLGAMGIACVSGRPRNWRGALLKRMQDVALGGVLLVFVAPAMGLIALAVRLDSKGPALYRQRRHGFNNRIITVLKFRTMRHDPGAPLQQVTRDDPRVTRLGRFLRRTSLDELPQLFNVLKGEMSLVGPRPHAIGMLAAERPLDDIVAEYAHRHRVKPGITGLAQVSGSRGALETPAQVRQRVRFDLAYVARASLWLDLQILLRTIPALLGDRTSTR